VPNDETLTIKSDGSSPELVDSLSVFLKARVLADSEEPVSRFVLDICNNRLALTWMEQPGLKPFWVTFDSRYPSQGKDPLLRAIGQTKGVVVDMTAGWCVDACHLARSGLDVIAIEHNALVYAMVRHTLDSHPVLAKLKLHFGESAKILPELASSADVVYLDPMYPLRSRSAASPKEITILRAIVETQEVSRAGVDSDAEMELFDLAMKTATKRVVVKRPHYAHPVYPGKVGETRGKQVRFDIYNPG
jgi:16S rRNA (guanine1516-N2)-methyltransferase